MGEIVVQICGDAQCLRDEFSKATNDGAAFAKDAEKTVTGRLQSAFSKLGSSIKNSLLPVVAVGAIIRKIGSTISNAVKTIKEFESALAELSAITGAVGEDLDFFKQQAIELGPQFGKGAKEIVNAFKLVGSARPELLKNSEALAEVTKQALVLSQASGAELESSVDALTSTLNQFNVPAENASDAINTLAAGSKAGAAPVDQISQSLVAFGAVANQNNVTLEESVGLIETLADKSIVGAEAGTKLRNVLTILSTADALPAQALNELEKFGVDLDVVTDSTIPLNQRLEEFSKIANDGTALVKVFGRENQVAGSIILNNVDRFNELTNAVTDTNVAYEQAEIVSQTLEFQTAKTEATYESLILSLDSGNGTLSNTATSYENVKQKLLEFLIVANDAEATNEQLSRSFLDFGLSISSALGGAGSALTEVDNTVKGIEGTIDRFVDKNIEAVFAVENAFRALGGTTEQIELGAGIAETALENQAVKVKGLVAEVLTLTGAEKERAEAALEIEKRILDGVQAEIEARKQLTAEALLGTVGPSADQLNAINALAEVEEEADKKAGEKKKKDREKLEQELKELRIKVLKDGLDEELALLELSFEEEKAKFKGNAEALALLDQQFLQDSDAIRQEFREKELEEQQKALKEIEANRKEAFEIEQGLIERSADEKILAATTEEAIAQDLADTEVQIEIEKLEKILELRKAAGEDTLEIDQQLANIRRDQAQQEIQAAAEQEAARRDAALEAVQVFRDQLKELQQARIEQQIEEIDTVSQKRIEDIDKQLESEDLSEERRKELLDLRQDEEEKAAKEIAKIRTQQAAQAKQQAIFEIAINGGVAISKSFTVDPTGILAAIIAAQVLVQSALVGAKPLPQFADGTPLVSGGVSGKDSVHALLMPKERVVPVADNMKYWGPLEAIRKGNYDDYVYTHNVLPAINNALASQRDASRSSFAENVANSLSLSSSFNDMNLLSSDKETRKILRSVQNELKSMNDTISKGSNIYQ